MTVKKIVLMTMMVMIMSSQAAIRKYNCTVETTSEYPSTSHTLLPVKTTTVRSDCIEDWGIVCTEDSQCCSNVCLKPFCKIIGVPDTPPTRKPGHQTTTPRRTNPTIPFPPFPRPTVPYPTIKHPTVRPFPPRPTVPYIKHPTIRPVPPRPTVPYPTIKHPTVRPVPPRPTTPKLPRKHCKQWHISYPTSDHPSPQLFV